jgi:dihydrofolate reductase
VSGSLTISVRKIKRRPGKDIYLGGGGELARSSLREDLTDELFIGVGPIHRTPFVPATDAVVAEGESGNLSALLTPRESHLILCIQDFTVDR